MGENEISKNVTDIHTAPIIYKSLVIIIIVIAIATLSNDHHNDDHQVRTASERFLAALENRWQGERSVLMPPLADILLEHTR